MMKRWIRIFLFMTSDTALTSRFLQGKGYVLLHRRQRPAGGARARPQTAAGHGSDRVHSLGFLRGEPPPLSPSRIIHLSLSFSLSLSLFLSFSLFLFLSFSLFLSPSAAFSSANMTTHGIVSSGPPLAGPQQIHRAQHGHPANKRVTPLKPPNPQNPNNL